MNDKTMEFEGKQAIFTSDHCLSCTSCMSACPVMKAAKEYRGPKLVGPAHGRLRFSQEDIEESLDCCTNCKSCDRACPAGVEISTLNMLRRAEYYRKHPHSRKDDMLAHNERMANLVRSVPFGPACANLGMKIGKSLGAFGTVGVAEERDMPSYAPETFLSVFKEIRQKPSDRKIVFYPGCFVNDIEPEVGAAFVEVMQKNGYEVLVDPQFNCCGSPMVVMGYLDEAKEHAHNNVKRILEWKAKGIPVVACCTSCSLMLKQEYTSLFDESEMREAGQNVYDAFEFLELLEEKGELNKDYAGAGHSEKILYHVPCHLKSQGIGTPAVHILREIPGVEISLADADCCGMSGNYGFQKDKYEISMKIGEKLFDRIRTAHADSVICDCGTCRLQIKHGTQQTPCHPIEILAKAYK